MTVSQSPASSKRNPAAKNAKTLPSFLAEALGVKPIIAQCISVVTPGSRFFVEVRTPSLARLAWGGSPASVVSRFSAAQN